MRALLDDDLVNDMIFAIDESPSMKHLTRTVVRVFDGLIASLAKQSAEFGQETRVSVYAFNSSGTERCILWDRDVRSIPSINGRYQPERGYTAAVDCAHLVLDDLKLIPQKYGDRAVAFWMLTDGADNDSRKSPVLLAQRFAELPPNVSIGAYVPDQRAKEYARAKCGYPGDAIKIWTPGRADAVELLGQEMANDARTFMTARATAKQAGVRFTGRSLFGLAEVQAAMVPLTKGSYETYAVGQMAEIAPFTRLVHGHYPVGKVYYEPTKTVTVQAGKDAIILGTDGRYYSGPLEDCRALLGLRSDTDKLNPRNLQTGGCKVFIKSTSHNRVLHPGTDIVVLR